MAQLMKTTDGLPSRGPLSSWGDEMSEAILRQDWLQQVELAFSKLKAASTAERQEWFEIIREDHGLDAEAELKAKLAAHDRAVQAKTRLAWRRDLNPLRDAIKVARDILDVSPSPNPTPEPKPTLTPEPKS